MVFAGDLGAVALWVRHQGDIESAAERALWKAYLLSPETLIAIDLLPQHRVGRYRLDFADPSRKIAIEVDGLAFHSGQAAFIRDQQRQRDLLAEGWTVIRFAAKEATATPNHCLAEIRRMVHRVAS